MRFSRITRKGSFVKLIGSKPVNTKSYWSTVTVNKCRIDHDSVTLILGGAGGGAAAGGATAGAAAGAAVGRSAIMSLVLLRLPGVL